MLRDERLPSFCLPSCGSVIFINMSASRACQNERQDLQFVLFALLVFPNMQSIAIISDPQFNSELSVVSSYSTVIPVCRLQSRIGSFGQANEPNAMQWSHSLGITRIRGLQKPVHPSAHKSSVLQSPEKATDPDEKRTRSTVGIFSSVGTTGYRILLLFTCC